jgi:uncharacterized protein with ATP-grasp and redox domains
MKTYLDCIPCFIRQTLDAVRSLTDDTSIHEEIVRDILSFAVKMDLDRPPPVMGQLIHRRIRELNGLDDPYRDIKKRFNRLALNMLPDMRSVIRKAEDPLDLALRVAIAGNVIDFGPGFGLTEQEARQEVMKALEIPVRGNIAAFRLAVEGATDILYLADNAGEIVFDGLLIRQLPENRVTMVVKGSPVINDATMEDAREVGLDEIVEVVDNGSDAPGTILEDCSEDFMRRFEKCDLVIAKGQGNFETLENTADKRIFFLFKVKCPEIAGRWDLELGSHVLFEGAGQ